MAKHRFKWYLHETEHSALAEELSEALGIDTEDELWEKVGRPFYEVTLHCVLDTETGAVTLERAEL